ncbi:hypothetical protein D3C72_1937770 [compost metagenome]
MAVLRRARMRPMARRDDGLAFGLHGDVSKDRLQFRRKAAGPDAHPLQRIGRRVVVTELGDAAFLALTGFDGGIEAERQETGKRDAKSNAHGIPRERTFRHERLIRLRGSISFPKVT